MALIVLEQTYYYFFRMSSRGQIVDWPVQLVKQEPSQIISRIKDPRFHTDHLSTRCWLLHVRRTRCNDASNERVNALAVAGAKYRFDRIWK